MSPFRRIPASLIPIRYENSAETFSPTKIPRIPLANSLELYLSYTTAEPLLPPTSILAVLQNTPHPVVQLNTVDGQLRVRGFLQPSILSSTEVLRCNDNSALVSCDLDNRNGNDEIFLSSDSQSNHINQAHPVAEPPAALEDCSTIGEHGAPELDNKQDKEIVANQGEEHNGAHCDIEILPDEDLESESEPEADRSDAQYKSDSNGEQNNTSGSNVSRAKHFLERTWSCLCDCEQQESIRSDVNASLDLSQMASYWRNLGVPDSIASISSPVETV